MTLEGSFTRVLANVASQMFTAGENHAAVAKAATLKYSGTARPSRVFLFSGTLLFGRSF